MWLAAAALASESNWQMGHALDLAALHEHAAVCQTPPPEVAEADRLMSTVASSVFTADALVSRSRQVLEEAGVSARVDGSITDGSTGWATVHWVGARGKRVETVFEASMEGGFHWVAPHTPEAAEPSLLPRALLSGWACRAKVVEDLVPGPGGFSVEPIVLSMGGTPWVFVLPHGDPSRRILGASLVQKCEGGEATPTGFGDAAYSILPAGDGVRPVVVQKLRSPAVNPSIMVQSAWNAQDVVVLTEGHVWMVMHDEGNHYLGPIPPTEEAARARVEALRALPPGGVHAGVRH